MSDTVIRVENLGKKYVIAHQQNEHYTTLRDSLAKGAKGLLKPFQNSKFKVQNPKSEEFWALKDVSFEIKQGDRVGIIGRNGAGKSTLLKILSRIVEPTSGRITIQGRVSSLLEVGTGFHPELTGRENIFLNGAILGMSKEEIKRKFDEIVAFAEVEKFLDTPVKRYSSGMYVRLAFAVAAHLEPEILIVDEVLAVGDAAFQEKCLGKMDEVSKQGRTVLFVSHSMQSISRLTNHCIFLQKGELQFEGATSKAIQYYLSIGRQDLNQPGYYKAAPGNSNSHLNWATVKTSDEDAFHRWGQPIEFSFCLQINEPREGLCFSFQVFNYLGQAISYHWYFKSKSLVAKGKSQFILTCKVPKFRIYMGRYSLTTWLTDRSNHSLIETLSHICPFEVTMQGFERLEYEWAKGDCTYIEDSEWEVVSK